MSNNFYTIGGEIRVQSEGGSIGSDITEEVIRVYMLQWDKELVRLCKKARILIDMYKRYLDDMFLVMRSVNPGWRYNARRGKLVFSREDELKDKDKSETQRSAELMASIANSINEDIKVTLDYPENHSDG